jgi:hypothetical protein
MLSLQIALFAFLFARVSAQCSCKGSCSNSEFASGGGNCPGNEKNCCDRTCNRGSPQRTGCGNNNGCFEVLTAFVTTPQNERTSG